MNRFLILLWPIALSCPTRRFTPASWLPQTSVSWLRTSLESARARSAKTRWRRCRSSGMPSTGHQNPSFHLLTGENGKQADKGFSSGIGRLCLFITFSPGLSPELTRRRNLSWTRSWRVTSLQELKNSLYRQPQVTWRTDVMHRSAGSGRVSKTSQTDE